VWPKKPILELFGPPEMPKEVTFAEKAQNSPFYVFHKIYVAIIRIWNYFSLIYHTESVRLERFACESVIYDDPNFDKSSRGSWLKWRRCPIRHYCRRRHFGQILSICAIKVCMRHSGGAARQITKNELRAAIKRDSARG